MVNKIITLLYYDEVNSLLNSGFTAGGQAERQAQQHRGTDEMPHRSYSSSVCLRRPDRRILQRHKADAVHGLLSDADTIIQNAIQTIQNTYIVLGERGIALLLFHPGQMGFIKLLLGFV